MFGQNNLWTKKIKKHINHASFMTNYPDLYLIMHAGDTNLYIQQLNHEKSSYKISARLLKDF